MSVGDAAAQVDGYVRKHAAWLEVLAALRTIVLDAGLLETIKWRTPCYTADGGNVVLIGAARDSVALSFLKGVLLPDPQGALEAPGANSRSARLMRFTDATQVTAQAETIRTLVLEAARLERAGVKVDLSADPEPPACAELRAALEADPALAAAFAGLTPGRRRGYLLHFAGAKRSETRAARVARWRPTILAGRGMLDR